MYTHLNIQWYAELAKKKLQRNKKYDQKSFLNQKEYYYTNKMYSKISDSIFFYICFLSSLSELWVCVIVIIIIIIIRILIINIYLRCLLFLLFSILLVTIYYYYYY